MIKIKRGLDVPISGAPEQRIEVARAVRSVALIGFDYHGMKPTMEVQVGDQVKLGQVLFSDKRSPGVVFTAPGAGRVAAVHRGEKRALQSVTIDLEGDEQIEFDRYTSLQLDTLGSELVRANLQRSGLWTALRTRPYSQVPKVDAQPVSIFVTAIDTHPLAADPAPIIAEQADAFVAGLKALGNLAGLYLCKAAGVTLPGEDLPSVRTQAFAGPHPAGLPGTHIHFLDPVGSDKQVWHIGYQDVIAVGILFLEGRLSVERVVALGGPVASRPRLLRTSLGASLDELCAGADVIAGRRL